MPIECAYAYPQFLWITVWIGHYKTVRIGSLSSEPRSLGSRKLRCQLARSAPFSLKGEGLGMRVEAVVQKIELCHIFPLIPSPSPLGEKGADRAN